MKSFRSVLTAATFLVCGLLVGLILPVSASSSDPIKGDINCDSEVDQIDSLLILKHRAGLEVDLPTGCAAIGTQLDQPSPTQLEATATPTPTPSSATFGDGTWIVGTDIQPGIWRNSDSSESCYWERLSGLGGTLDDIIANEFDDSIQTVEIKASDFAFHADGCGTWSQNLTPPSSGPDQPFGQGAWLVGEEVSPGLWRNSDSSESCYWERRSGLGGTSDEIIANEFSDTIQTVDISPSDVAFYSDDCGTWTKIG